ncbi:MAG TPA: hypothetical protein PKD55_15265 [Bellilinea sp.]|nr:hypothetical protein [Bellilinea sp.]
MTRPLPEKMGIKESDRVLILNAPEDWLSPLDAASLLPPPDGGQYEHVLFFAVHAEEISEAIEGLKRKIGKSGKIWITWPKGGKLGTDLNLDKVVKLVYPKGLVESVNLAVDGTWTALKFTWPKPGKDYNNSHAVLIRDPNQPEQAKRSWPSKLRLYHLPIDWLLC